MRIELEHTREDWQAYVNFILERSQGLRRRLWIVLLATAGALPLLFFAGHRLGWRFDAYSVLAGVLIVYVVIAVFARVNRRASQIPESWLGPHVYELREDGFHRESALGHAVARWGAVREIRESPGHIFLALDNITTLVIPKRALESQGGATAVIAEIERLRAISAAPSEAAQPATVDEATATAAPVSPATPPAVTAKKISRWSALPRNLLGGLKLVTFLPVRADAFQPSARQVALLLALTLGLWGLIQRLLIGDQAEFNWWMVGQVAWLTGVALFLLAMLVSRSIPASTTTCLFTAIASATPWLVLVGLLASQAAISLRPPYLLALAFGAYAGAVVYRAQRAAIGELRVVAVGRAALMIVPLWLVFATTVYVLPEFWYAAGDDEGENEWYEAESVLFAQPDLIDAAVERVATGREGTTETYFVGFAGFGEQGVFDREARFAGEAFGRRLDLSAHSLVLINKAEPDEGTPLATLSGLRRALAGVGKRMNSSEDVLLLFLTSHGSEDAELSVSQGALPLDQLDGESLRVALDDAGIQWRIIIISACYSGSFIPFLSNERTLIITAARADRTSFGCSDDRDLTYFGEALLRDALPVSTDLLDAVQRAGHLIDQREHAEKLEPSQPQVFVGEEMREKLPELVFLPNGVAGTAQTAANR